MASADREDQPLWDPEGNIMSGPDRGGPVLCPRPCGECGPEHHFSEAMIETAETDPRSEPARLGVPAWYVCKHCPAWRIDLDDENEGEADQDGADAATRPLPPYQGQCLFPGFAAPPTPAPDTREWDAALQRVRAHRPALAAALRRATLVCFGPKRIELRYEGQDVCLVGAVSAAANRAPLIDALAERFGQAPALVFAVEATLPRAPAEGQEPEPAPPSAPRLPDPGPAVWLNPATGQNEPRYEVICGCGFVVRCDPLPEAIETFETRGCPACGRVWGWRPRPINSADGPTETSNDRSEQGTEAGVAGAERHDLSERVAPDPRRPGGHGGPAPTGDDLEACRDGAVDPRPAVAPRGGEERPHGVGPERGGRSERAPAPSAPAVTIDEAPEPATDSEVPA